MVLRFGTLHEVPTAAFLLFEHEPRVSQWNHVSALGPWARERRMYVPRSLALPSGKVQVKLSEVSVALVTYGLRDGHAS